MRRQKAGKLSFPWSSAVMEAFELRRAELLHSTATLASRQWFVLNAKICGIKVGKFLSTSPLVATFPSEFSTVQLTDLKNGGSLDRRCLQENRVAIASLFGVVAAILRQKFKEGEEAKYIWLIDAINSLSIGTEPDEIRAASSDIFREELKAASDATTDVEKKNDQLKADLDRAWEQLESLSKDIQNFSRKQTPDGNEKNPKQEKEEEIAEDVWASISDVCDKFHVHLADLIAGEVHNPDVARLLSDIAEKVTNKSSPLQALETMLGDSTPQFFQSLRVPDWTLLYFKLQSRVPDQAWQTLLSLTKLGRTGVSHTVDFLFRLEKSVLAFLLCCVGGLSGKSQLHCS